MISRRKFSPKFKAKVALEAIKEQQSIVELCQKYEISPAQIGQWKQLFFWRMHRVFLKKGVRLSIRNSLILEQQSSKPLPILMGRC